MKVGQIEGATRTLGAPPDWDPKVHGRCEGLPIRDGSWNGTAPEMVSAWYPTNDEVERLARGAPIFLTVIGWVHPPVSLMVGAASRDVGGD